tara:strand:- start:507 stop:1106 length:600 start_codon:yes stop_codon:yes gene_type:complete
MIKLKDLLTEAPKIKKVKNVSVQYMDAEYQGETLHGFKYFKKGPWLYKKDNGEYFAVVITNKNNRYEIQLGKHKNNIQATAAVEKIIKRNLNKFESVNENKSDKKTFDKIVKALKDVKVRATIHLNDNDKITIALGRDYFRKKNPEGKGDLTDMVEDRLKKAGIQKGYNLPPGVDIMADSSDIGDKKYTKAQHDIRGGV